MTNEVIHEWFWWLGFLNHKNTTRAVFSNPDITFLTGQKIDRMLIHKKEIQQYNNKTQCLARHQFYHNTINFLPDITNRHEWVSHWGGVTHICVNKLTIIASDNGLSPGRRQAIIWTNVGILLIGPWGTNFSEISIGIQAFSFKKMHLKMLSVKWRPFCLGLNVLNILSGVGVT